VLLPAGVALDVIGAFSIARQRLETKGVSVAGSAFCVANLPATSWTELILQWVLRSYGNGRRAYSFM